MAEISIQWVLMIIMLLCGIQDLCKKKIYLWILLIGAVLICLCLPFCNPNGLIDRVGGLTLGFIVILISLITSGKIGLGDGFLLCITGLGLGFWRNLELFAIALFMASVFSIILLALRLANRKNSIPFVPFLFVGYLFVFFTKQ
jgi:Type IV leader peptidase family.